MSLVGLVQAHLASGGVVMVPIVALSLVMWWLIFLKARELFGFLRPRCTSRGGCGYGGAGWKKAIARDYLRSRSGCEELDVELCRVLVSRHAARAEKGIPTILVLAAVAPLLGLLGTVSGMIGTFDVIAEFGTGNARGLASGISQALITTQSGLMVAVPGMVAGGLLYRMSVRLRRRMELFLGAVERGCAREVTA
ncbi:biopolymer transport protein ExbB [Desulfobaculum xiamenense]|uniref:Biopolymer transport protein ExbB n=1 Tax=Desulfobaculum xiamenense TaxID=995050 RepID=A0A846QE81_9BACT|nr:MotA/TolQ/ExbB proton channel family protein [Desulfobaculum xiamenense]NJB66678.1 biopolymer transport protein ExbB [Desulfobaculum xiamenense]